MRQPNIIFSQNILKNATYTRLPYYNGLMSLINTVFTVFNRGECFLLK